MKSILITGKNSYIGTSFKRWVEQYPDKYEVESISVRDDSWKERDFSRYDVVFHVAAFVHKKEKPKMKDLYFKVNRDLAYEVASKAKHEGVKQFVFLSTMSAYGIENGFIDEKTSLIPKSNYGKSKLQAEELIKPLETKNFKIAILRPPMVYGMDCTGNFSRLEQLAKITPIFPDIDNIRSMIYIDNLNEFVRLLIDNNSSGVFYPQNKEYVNTSEMIRMIAEVNDKRVLFTRLFNPLFKLLNITIVNKVFGNLVYEMSMSDYPIDYRVCDFRESIFRTMGVSND